MAGGLRHLPVLPGGASAVLDEPGARGDRQADRRRRPLHERRPDGRRDPLRRLRPDRGGPARDRRPVPPPQDRRGPPRRHPRVHRGERLHHEGGGLRPRRLHPERHRRRGVPPRLASGAVRADARTPSVPCSWWARGRPAWSARWCSANAASRPSTSSTRRTRSAAASAGRGGCPPSATGVASPTGVARSSTSCPNVEVITGRRLSTRGRPRLRRQHRRHRDRQPLVGRRPPARTAPPDQPAAGRTREALTPERVMTGERPTGQRVAVYDVDGYYVGPGIAELLAAEGYDVHLVTARTGRLADLGRHPGGTDAAPAPARRRGDDARRGHRAGVRARPRRRRDAVRRPVDAGRRRRRPRHAAGPDRRPLPRPSSPILAPSRRPASPACTSSGMRSRRAGSRSRCSTGTGWPGRSTCPTRPSPRPCSATCRCDGG